MPIPSLNVASWVSVTESEGPGKRFALWVQGCPFRCPGCCNPHYLAFREAQRMSVDEIWEKISEVQSEVEGLTFIGGEPFSQAEALAALAEKAQAQDLSVMIFSGYELLELQSPEHLEFASRQALLSHSDLLVDGQYREKEPDHSRRWIGSTNQQIHFLSDRYRHLEKDWDTSPDTIELKLINGKLTINGDPDADITQLNKLLARK